MKLFYLDQCKQNPFPTNTVAGEVIFDGGSAVDPNNDTLYYSMSTTPVTDNFEIGISEYTSRRPSSIALHHRWYAEYMHSEAKLSRVINVHLTLSIQRLVL